MGSRAPEDHLVLDELQQLGHMVQVLSYELTVLQDFMKDNYGVRFDSYRRKHMSAQPNRDEQSRCSRMPVSNESGRSMRTSSSKVKKEATILEQSRYVDDDVNEDEESQDDDDGHRNTEDSFSAMMMDDDNPDADNNADGDPLGDNDDNNEPLDIQDKDWNPGHQRTEKTGIRGKPRNAIWKQYLVTKSSDGKVQAKCPKCSDLVSSKVARLIGHFRKCVLGIKPSCAPEHEENKRRVRQLIQSKKSTSTLSIAPSPSGHSRNRCSYGRKPDPVWNYFNVKEAAEKKIITCKTCNLEVSGKAARMRKHFILCHELDKDNLDPEPKGSGSESDNS